MDGIHDLGGRQGFGPIRYAVEARRLSMRRGKSGSMRSMAWRSGAASSTWTNTGTRSSACPRHYLSASYYERSLTSLATLCVEKGIVAREELEKLAQGAFPLSEPSAPGRSNLPDRETFQPGDRVRVKNDFFAGHVRMPGYIRGKPGVVVSESPRYPFPDAHAHGVEAADEPTYDVAFRTEDLWPNSADKALVHVGVFQSYLERAT